MYFFNVFITLMLSVVHPFNVFTLILSMLHRFVRLTCLFLITAMLVGGMPARPALAEGYAPVDHDQVVFSFPGGSGAGALGIGRSNLAGSSPADPLIEGDQVGPSALVVDQGLFYVLDSLNNRILVQDPQSGERQSIALPDGYFADMLIKDKTIYLSDFNRPGLLALDEANGQIVPARSSLGLSQATANLAMLSDLTATTKRTDDHQGTLTVFDASKAQLAELSIQSEHYLGSARLLGRDGGGNYYVMVEELLEDVPAMLVDTSVRRYAPDGTYLDAALLPMEEINYFPNRPVAVDPQGGGAYFLKVTQSQADVVRLEFSTGMPSSLDRRWADMQQSVQYTG